MDSVDIEEGIVYKEALTNFCETQRRENLCCLMGKMKKKLVMGSEAKMRIL